MVNAIPAGYGTVTPYVMVADVGGLLGFLERALGAVTVRASRLKDGTIMHAEARVGNSPLMFGQAKADFPAMPSGFYVYVEDCDALYARAVAAGAEVVMPPTDMFYGDRHGGVKDPAGNYWWIATHVKDVSDEEVERFMQQHC